MTRRERVKVEKKLFPYKLFIYNEYYGRFESLDSLEQWLKTLEVIDSTRSYYNLRLAPNDYLNFSREDIEVVKVLQEEITELVDFR
jgi:hypothetical protein